MKIKEQCCEAIGISIRTIFHKNDVMVEILSRDIFVFMFIEESWSRVQ
jgi:hypothetical protein